MRHNLLKQLSLLALLLLGEALAVRAQPASPCPATGISTDPNQPTNPLRPDRRNTFFNWFAPGGTGPYANRLYSAYSLDPRTGQGVAYDQYTPYQQPDNAKISALLGAGDLPANGWELLAYNLGYTEKGQPRSGGADLLYVVLYHRFTGIMRVFATEANPVRSYTTHFITLRFASGTGLAFKSGLLNRVAAPATALLDAPAGVAAVLHGVGTHLNYGGKWFFADFPLDYDPCTCLFRSELEVAIGGLDPRIPSSGLIMPGLSSINVAGPVSGVVSSPYGADEVNLAGLPVLGYAGQVPGAFLTTGYSSTSVAGQQRNSRVWLQARTHDAALAVALDSAAWYWFKARDADASTGSRRFLSPGFLQNPRTERLTNGLDFLTLGGFSANLPGPGVTSVAPPSAFAQTGSRLRGYSAPTHSMGIVRLATPGAVAAPAAPDSSRYPYYNEVLGVLSLLRRPVVERSVEPIRDVAGQPRLRYRYRLPADLEYALNPAAGLEVTDFRAALVVGGSAYPGTPTPGDFGTYEAPVPLTDDPAGPVRHLLRTSYVGAGCLSERVFTLDGPAGCGAGFLPDSAVSVKIWVQLRRPGVPAAQSVLLVARYPVRLVEVPALGPGLAAGPCTGLLAPQPSYAVAALCLSPAYAEAMRLGRASTAASTTPAPAATVALNVFPNPTTGPVSVRLTLPEPQCVRLRLYDGLGRLVAVPLASTPYPAGSTSFVLSNMPRLAAGLYFLMLDADNRRLATTQLVVAAE